MLGNERKDRVIGEVLIGQRLQVGMIGQHKGVVLDHDGHAICRAHALDHDKLAAGLHAKKAASSRVAATTVRDTKRAPATMSLAAQLGKALDIAFLANLAFELGAHTKVPLPVGG